MSAALARRFLCEHCFDLRCVNHPNLGVIRCPQCTVRTPTKDPDAMPQLIVRQRSELTGAEARRVIHAIDAILARAAAHAGSLPKLPHHLVATDAVLQRWAAAPSGMPSDDPDLQHVSRPPPLDAKTQEAVSDIVKTALPGIRSFILDWYCRHWKSIEQMFEDRRMTRRQLGRLRENVLVEMRTRFLASPHHDLVRLALFEP